MLIDSIGRDAQADAWLYIDEITHRVCNDYSFMLAALDRASRQVCDPVAAQALSDVRARLNAGARAHRLLQPRGEGARRLDCDLEHWSAALSESKPTEAAVSFTLCCEPVELGAQQAWQASLIVSELVANALKHAFVGVRTGEITIDLRWVKGAVRIGVADNGCAADAKGPGRGSWIVDTLVRELGGAVWRKHTRSGSTVVVVFQPTPTFNGA